MAVPLRRIAKAGKRWLHLGHRWLGIGTGLLFATWFASGLVMMYVAFPALTQPERLAGLPPLAWDAVRVSPDAALASEREFPRAFTLSTRGPEPAYAIVAWDGARRAISAVDGRPLGPVDAAGALAIAALDPRAQAPSHRGTVGYDLWSVHQRYDPLRPLHRIALGDPAGTEFYVSGVTGAVVLDTDRHERFWNWFGAVPHWLYVAPLRANAELWRDVVLWLSGIAMTGAASGLALGLIRARPGRRYPSGALTPYRGVRRLHHLAGLVGGIAVVCFIVSGWLSMNPNRWFSGGTPSPDILTRYAAAPGARAGLDLGRVRAGACADAVEVRFTWIDGAPRAVTACRDGGQRVCCGPARLDPSQIAAALRKALPSANLVDLALLREEDLYWSSRTPRPLPVLRAVFDDPAATWFHVDPETGEILNRLNRSGRVERWAFNLLHTLDLPLLLRHRPAWDAAMLLLLAAGSVVTLSGLVLGWRRLRRPRPASTVRRSVPG